MYDPGFGPNSEEIIKLWGYRNDDNARDFIAPGLGGISTVRVVSMSVASHPDIDVAKLTFDDSPIYEDVEMVNYDKHTITNRINYDWHTLEEFLEESTPERPKQIDLSDDVAIRRLISGGVHATFTNWRKDVASDYPNTLRGRFKKYQRLQQPDTVYPNLGNV